MLLTCSVWTVAPLHSLWSVEYVRAFLILQYAIGMQSVYLLFGICSLSLNLLYYIDIIL